MTRHEQLVEQYEDAYFALLMESVSQLEGARLEKLNIDLQNNSPLVSEALDRRCLNAINRHFSHTRRLDVYRLAKKAINVAAIIIALMTILFTTAFAASNRVRLATLNLVITINESYAQLNIENMDVAGNNHQDSSNLFFENIHIAWLPEGYQYSSGTYDAHAIFNNEDGDWFTIAKISGLHAFNVDTENAEVVENIEINGNSGIFVVKNGQSHLVLADTSKNFYLDIAGAEMVSSDTIKEIAKNIFVN